VTSPTPYWLETTSLPPSSEEPLPGETDVLIVGGGYTGLAAAHESARAGLSTLVLDEGDIGGGCSSRNGGQVAYSIKPSFAALRARHGTALAGRIVELGREAVDHLRSLALDAGLDCDWRGHGTFVGAHTARHFRRLAAQVRAGESEGEGGGRISIVSRAEQRRELASDFYHGGCVHHDDASIDPARLLAALWRRACGAGASVRGHCKVLAIERGPQGFVARTARGVLRARRVLLATNGYGGDLSPWHRRRVIPIGSYQIATAPLGAARMRELIPERRNVGDTRRVVVYFRPSPDGERLIFGGRAALRERDPLACVARLRAMMTEIFPQLRGVDVTHAWAGWVAYTFDTMPHTGSDRGLFHCMGYCGQGVPLAVLLGRRAGQRLAGLDAGRTALDDLPFPARPYYRTTPWFLAPSVFAYRLMDRLGL
jgi:glycine/D-amino acid oxidase-like deaminating enzyme